jgi:DNA-directed RNA polymerase specialized sigma24 family protein
MTLERRARSLMTIACHSAWQARRVPWPPAAGCVRHLRLANHAEDLVQEAYERVLRRPRFVRRDHDLAHLLRVMRHVLSRLCRAREQVALRMEAS